MKIWSCRNQPIRSKYYFVSTNQQRVFTCRKAVLLLHEVTHWKVSIRCASLRQEDWVVETKELVSSNQKLVIFVSTNQQRVLPPILWRLSKRNSYLSGKPILGWIRSKMREQDMMAPPFSIALWGLSRSQYVYSFLLSSSSILFLSRQISLKFLPLGSYPMYSCTVSWPRCWRQTA